MGACETTPPTTRDRGNQTSDLRTHANPQEAVPRSRLSAAACRHQPRSSSPLRGCGRSTLTPPGAAAQTGSDEEKPQQQSHPPVPGGRRTKSSESTGHRHISSYSSSSSSGHQPSRDVTGTCFAPWYCLSRARQLSRSCRYRSSRSRCRSAAPVDTATSARATAPRRQPPGPRSARPCSASTRRAADVAEADSRAALATSAPRASSRPSDSYTRPAVPPSTRNAGWIA
jgi:hypothetical protein